MTSESAESENSPGRGRPLATVRHDNLYDDVLARTGKTHFVFRRISALRTVNVNGARPVTGVVPTYARRRHAVRVYTRRWRLSKSLR